MTERAGRRVDPDVDLRVPRDRRELARHPAAVVGAVAVGGVLGSLARAGLQAAFPHGPGTFAWATFGINLTGCLLIGALMAVLRAVGGGSALARPFLGVGVLGGFTTFSTYVVDVHQALVAGAPGVALGYLVSTVVGALLAVWAGDTLAGRLLRRSDR
ncbi:fluoride efflux transporter FluC [Micromonospora avicenniae]|uniref:Fluoride-specific ion channel FluC n=1 Tax=Micromonospora avicenniae TaxID=1198245 RepID=A0A1N7D7I9_9ACTN|nr:CrcB family protein [Micromonospora avicenniae]SIR71781.1 camphor resistance protein CrcB [Micromonospora avicenniae]